MDNISINMNKNKLFKRVIWIILDSVGAGEAPDSANFLDKGADTLGHIISEAPDIHIPNMTKLGLFCIDGTSFEDKDKEIIKSGVYGKAKELSSGKDTTIGHWEMIGVINEKPFPTYKDGFPDDIINEFIEKTKVPGVLGNCVASGTEIIKELGEEHIQTKKPIIYTSADSVFQIACHEDVYSPEELYEMCRVARKILTGDNSVARVIARPFEGVYPFARTANRRDFSLKPNENNVLSYLKKSGYEVAAVGKIEDIFANVGITQAVHTKDNEDGIDKTLDYMKSVKEGLIFTNLVEFDSKWGHRRDLQGYKKGLEDFDIRLQEVIDNMNEDDLLIINADHGCDPTYKGTDHTREYIPILTYSKKMKTSKNLGVLNSFADIGQTIGENFEMKEIPAGKSFLRIIREACHEGI